jgi:hypothetical protein
MLSKLTSVFLHSISQVVFVMNTQFVFFQVGNELFSIISIIDDLNELFSIISIIDDLKALISN